MIHPIDTVIAVTYRCQSRCRMCSIWQIEGHEEAPPEVYARLPATIRDVNISGGEPFLRKDLNEVVRIVHERLPRARIVVSTNGLLGSRLVPRALELVRIDPGIGFGFSIDGIGEMQEYIRGVKGAYDNVLEAVKGLIAEGVANIRLAYTLTSENSGHMLKVYRLARELGVQFTMSLAHDSDFFFGSHDSSIVGSGHPAARSMELRRDFETIIRSELSAYRLKSWGKAFIYQGMYEVLSEGKRPFPNRPGVDFFYLDPRGDIYPSVVHNFVMGNLAEQDFDTIWSSERSGEIRAECRNDPAPYWMGCMLRKALLDHRFSIGLWALKNKFLHTDLHT
jgi:MoaA/NifB/PqqE/SkfB family radical SAM enzyme